MPSRPFDFTGADGQPLSGRLDVPDGPVRAHALFAHCFTCSKSSVAAVRIARALTAKGFGVLRFDFTGLGESGGAFADTSFSSNIGDLVAAASAMTRAGIAPSLLIGHSLGGAAALAAAGDLPSVKAVATLATPFDVDHVKQLFGPGLARLEEQGEAEVMLGGRPFTVRRDFVEDLAAHDQAARIKALKRPLLILHAPRDDVAGIDNATSIFMAARHPKSFVSLDDADHLLTRPADAAYAAEVIAAWASRYLAVDMPLRSEAQSGFVVVEETGEGGFQVEVRAGGAHFLADEPVEVGGLGSGPTPYDLLGAGLGACTAMTLRLYARGKGLPLERVRVTVGHSKSKDAAPPDLFVRQVRLEGALTDDQRRRLVEIAERCPVHRTLAGGARIDTTAEDITPLPAVDSPTQHEIDSRDTIADAERERDTDLA
ncbi:alpha/beta fold hydrolase [Sphingosinicella humi]|uniref:Osmotically inducible protein C n=1 Tax=Allosphingosinicella humi TaxID=2068657 RepID=A0A2U2J1S7_9SPHN|nr:alpha/beta fold hydrolase [Sphingosinicella humi]PWG02297.1 osmotically inducible protein C [Sphingosinicella humi]